MTTEQMRQNASEAKKAAKTLQQKLKTVTDTEERKQLARQMNDLFTQASVLRNKAKHYHWFKQSVEREFISIAEDMYDV